MGSIFVAEITYETSTLINDIFNKNSSPPAITSPFTESPPFFWDWRIKYFLTFTLNLQRAPPKKSTEGQTTKISSKYLTEWKKYLILQSQKNFLEELCQLEAWWNIGLGTNYIFARGGVVHLRVLLYPSIFFVCKSVCLQYGAFSQFTWS